MSKKLQKLDEYKKEHLFENRKQSILHHENILSGTHEEVGPTFAPFITLWSVMPQSNRKPKSKIKISRYQLF